MPTQLAGRVVLLVVCWLPAASLSQVSFEQTARDLASPDPTVRLRAVRLLKAAAYPEAAVPLAKLVGDPQDDIQLEAIAAELNIFLAEKIIPQKRVGFLIEVRNRIAADTAFSNGPSVLGPRSVPSEVLNSLRVAARAKNPRVGLEALYAFGTLAPAQRGIERRELLRASGPDLASMLGASDPAFRFAALRVIGRLFEKRREDPPVEEPVGDAVITVLNDSDYAIRGTAMQTLGAMRYERAVEALTSLYQYFGKGDLAEASLDAVARIAHPSSAPLFLSVLTGKSSALKGIAVEGLARLGDRSRLADIQAALASDRGESLLLAGQFATARLNDAPVDQLAEALSRPRLHDQAQQYLIEIAPGRTPAFTRYAQDPDARIRADVADILGLAGDPAALPIVEPMLKDRDPQVALAAARAIARLHAIRGVS